MLLLCTFCSTSVALSVGVGKASGTDTGRSVNVEVPALLGMLKVGPHGLGLTEGVSVNAETVLVAVAGVSLFLATSICLKSANRSGNIFLGIVTVFLAAFSCHADARTVSYGSPCSTFVEHAAHLLGQGGNFQTYRCVSIVRVLFEDSIDRYCIYDIE